MTAMNWEGLKRRGKASDYSGDDLPLIGSWADQRRYGALPPSRRQHHTAPSQVVTSSRKADFEELQRYVQHASHPDFMRKPCAMRKEMVGIITKLHARCMRWQASLLAREVMALQDAARLLSKLRINN